MSHFARFLRCCATYWHCGQQMAWDVMRAAYVCASCGARR
ncbi:hypothetical protein FHS13_004191 [Nocardiopsis algeriensis]|uniref:Uncharacterized protein n=1 Tax=Nocardiopsis algeriensis TaxID=1478215 RepID=A0A841IVK3_9ACTN|nr:hypothetical protein [Nocardiopsis algeriensis]